MFSCCEATGGRSDESDSICVLSTKGNMVLQRQKSHCTFSGSDVTKHNRVSCVDFMVSFLVVFCSCLGGGACESFVAVHGHVISANKMLYFAADTPPPAYQTQDPHSPHSPGMQSNTGNNNEGNQEQPMDTGSVGQHITTPSSGPKCKIARLGATCLTDAGRDFSK